MSLCVVVFASCADEGADDGTLAASCVQTELVTQCPPNTVPNLQADSEAVCGQTTSLMGDALGAESEITNYCVGTGSCAGV